MQHGLERVFSGWARIRPRKFAAILKDPAMREKIKQDKEFQTWVSETRRLGGVVMGRASRAA